MGIYETEKRINCLYKTNTTANWAKSQLKILADMAKSNGIEEWFEKEVRRIYDGIYITTPEDK